MCVTLEVMAKDLDTRMKELEDQIKDPQSRLHVEGLLVSSFMDPATAMCLEKHFSVCKVTLMLRSWMMNFSMVGKHINLGVAWLDLSKKMIQLVTSSKAFEVLLVYEG